MLGRGGGSVEILWKSWLKWSSVASQDQLGLCEPHCMTILSVRAQECDWHSDCRFSRGAILDLESGSHWLVGWSWGGGACLMEGKKNHLPSMMNAPRYLVVECVFCKHYTSETCITTCNLNFFLSFYIYRLCCVCKHSAKDRTGL